MQLVTQHVECCGTVCCNAVQVPGWGRSGKLLDFTIIGVKMDVLIKANLPGGPPKPLLLTDYQSMKEEQLKVNDQISVVHFPKYPPGFQRCSNTLNIIKIEGRSWYTCVISIPPVGHACIHMYMASSHTDVHTHITSPWYTYNTHY